MVKNKGLKGTGKIKELAVVSKKIQEIKPADESGEIAEILEEMNREETDSREMSESTSSADLRAFALPGGRLPAQPAENLEQSIKDIPGTGIGAGARGAGDEKTEERAVSYKTVNESLAEKYGAAARETTMPRTVNVAELRQLNALDRFGAVRAGDRDMLRRFESPATRGAGEWGGAGRQGDYETVTVADMKKEREREGFRADLKKYQPREQPKF